MTSDVHHPDISVGDRVVVLTGTRKGEEGRVVVRKNVTAFDSYFGTVFEVDFEDGPNGRGYTTQFQPHHLERI